MTPTIAAAETAGIAVGVHEFEAASGARYGVCLQAAVSLVPRRMASGGVFDES